MSAPLLSAERRQTRALAGRAVRLAFEARFGRGPRRSRPLYELDPFVRLALVDDVEKRLGVAFSDEDIEFVETEADLVDRAARALMRAGS